MTNMKYRLLFKNKKTDEVAVVTVEVPEFIKDFQLVGSAKTVSMYEPVEEIQTAGNHILEAESKNIQKNSNVESLPEKFESGVNGTARLSTYKGQVVIGYRRGTTSKNQTTPTSVCISDVVKQEFFNDTRDEPIQYRVYEKDNPSLFNKWFTYIKEEYARQQKSYCAIHN